MSYSSQRQRIIKEIETRGRDWGKRALKHLDAEYGAEDSVKGGKRVGVVLDSGTIVCKKKSFKTHEAAEHTLGQIQLSQVNAETTPHRAYQCAHCGKWHLTHAADPYVLN